MSASVAGWGSRSPDDGSSHTAHRRKTSTCPTLPSRAPDLTTFCRLDELGLVAVGQCLEPDRAVIECRVAEPDPWCRRCGCRGRCPRTRSRAGSRTSRSGIGPRRCWSGSAATSAPAAGVCWRQDTTAAARTGRSCPVGGLRLGAGSARGRPPHRVAVSPQGSGCRGTPRTPRSSPRANGVLIDDPAPVRRRRRDRRRRARLAAHPPRRQVRHRDHRPHPGARRDRARHGCWTWSRAARKQVFKTWLAERPQALAGRDRGRRDGRVHRVQDRRRRRAARRGHGDGPVPRRPPRRRRARRLPPPRPAGHARPPRPRQATRSTRPAAPCTPAPGCSPTSSTTRLDALFADDEHVEVEATWGVYQRMIAAYREPDRQLGKYAHAGR